MTSKGSATLQHPCSCKSTLKVASGSFTNWLQISACLRRTHLKHPMASSLYVRTARVYCENGAVVCAEGRRNRLCESRASRERVLSVFKFLNSLMDCIRCMVPISSLFHCHMVISAFLDALYRDALAVHSAKVCMLCVPRFLCSRSSRIRAGNTMFSTWLFS